MIEARNTNKSHIACFGIDRLNLNEKKSLIIVRKTTILDTPK